MFRNYLTIAWRNLRKNKAFSFLNISGLAIGMASALFILIWVENEVSYDKFHVNKEYLFEAWNRAVFDGKLQCWAYTPQILGETIKKDYPEVSNMARVRGGWFVVSSGENKFSSEFRIVDPSFLTMFSFPLLEGNPKTALHDIHSIVITKKMAIQLFGKEPAMNKTIKIDSNNFIVTGVAKDLPPNTMFSFDYLLNWDLMKRLRWDDVHWDNNSCETFVQLKPGVNPDAFNAKIAGITMQHDHNVKEQEIFLHPLKKWHLYSHFENGKQVGGQIESVRMFVIIAAFILLIACINFMNLSTARSEKRAKEVGIRKVSGAYKSSLIFQFLGESLFIAMISGFFALILVELFLPSFNLLVGKELFLPLTNPMFWFYAILFVLLTGILAGSYPAFFLSSFKPVAVLKGSFKNVQALVTPRRLLVVLQFSFAIILIISTVVVLQQIRYGQSRNTGYDQNRLVYHYLTGDLAKNYPMVKNEILQSGIATLVNRTSWPMTEIWSDTWGIEWEGKDANDKTDFMRFSTDEKMVKTVGLKLVAGRDFDLAQYPTDSMGVLLNETAVKAMGFKSPVGQPVRDDGQTFHVVGVVKDFVVGSPFQPVSPMVIFGIGGHTGINVLNVKLKDGGNTEADLKKLGAILKKYNPQYPFEYHFVDRDYERKFTDQKRTGTLSALFAGLTILISCIGLFGLASFVAIQRTKEIGVRKVLGASLVNLWQLLSRDFVVLVLISLCIAVPVSWYFMHDWLLQFNYRTPLSWWIFASAGLGALLITLITVSFQSIKAALANPVKSLRTE